MRVTRLINASALVPPALRAAGTAGMRCSPSVGSHGAPRLANPRDGAAYSPDNRPCGPLSGCAARIQAVIMLALGAVPAWAQQQVGVQGATAGLDAITGTPLDTLASVSVIIPNTGTVWHCVATCSVEVGQIGGTGTDVDGRLAITFNGDEVAGTDRKFELNDNAGINDPENMEVSTTGRVVNLSAGTQTIACAAAKVFSSDPNFNVNDSSITVVCSDFVL